MQIPFLDLGAGIVPLREEINAAIAKVIDSAAFAGGPFVEAFEKEFSSFIGRNAVGVSNGTDALALALRGLDIGPGDEVITVPNSFIATAEAISLVGARPVFVDIDPVTYTMNPKLLSGALSSRTKAVIPVHLFGHPADMDPILAFARKNNLFVIEDAAQAHGAEYKGRRVGTFGDAAAFSFYPGKNLGAFGEAGAVVTPWGDLAKKIRRLRDHGQVRKYDHVLLGGNWRMDGIQAAVLSVKLRYLEEGNRARRLHADLYNSLLFRFSGLVTPTEASYATHVYHLYVVRLNNRDEVARILKAKGIGTGVHYPVPIHLQLVYRSLGYRPGAFPVVEAWALELLSLPMYPELKPGAVTEVVRALKEAVKMPVAA